MKIDTAYGIQDIRKRQTLGIHMEYGTFSSDAGPSYEHIHDENKDRFTSILDSLKTHRGQALLGLVLFILFSIMGYAMYIYIGSYSTTSFISKKGNLVLNGYNMSSNWGKLDIVNNKASELRPPVKTKTITQEDIEEGYFPTYIYGVGHKNVTFDNILSILSGVCKNCTCIGTAHILVHSNIVFINREENDIFMIEPRIDAYSTSSQNAMLKKTDHPINNDALYLPNYRSVPTTIVVHYINSRANKDIIDLSYKQAACVYLTIEQNKKYL